MSRRPLPQPFDLGATYCAKEPFVALRDSFDPKERLVHFRHAVSAYDGMQGWFFFVVGTKDLVRAWDVEGVGAPPATTPFERVEDVHPLVKSAVAGDVGRLGALLAGDAIDEAYVRVALDCAIEGGQAAAAKTIVERANLTEALRTRALGEAAAQGKLDVVRSLLAAGIAPTDETLGRAIWARSKPIVELLIERGADPRKTGRPLQEWIDFCNRQYHPEIAALLERYR